MEKIIYLDNNATTPIHPEVKKAIIEAIDYYGNPSSMHQAGRVVSEAISNSRNIIANFINSLRIFEFMFLFYSELVD